MDLKSLAIHYITDKEISFGHDYIPGYIDLFEERRNEIKTFLEIGIGLGEHYDVMMRLFPKHIMAGGLMMWRDYFPNAQIYGLDVHPCPVEAPRITTVVGDQGSEAVLMDLAKKMGGSIDIVIDDGSHRLEHQIFSFAVLAEFMAPGGIYVIEDVQPPHAESFMTLSVFPEEFQAHIRENFDYKWYDTRAKTGRNDDFLMVFIKK